LDSGVASSEPLLVCASVGGPPAAGRRSPCSWIIFRVPCHRLVVEDRLLMFCIKSIIRA